MRWSYANPQDHELHQDCDLQEEKCYPSKEITFQVASNHVTYGCCSCNRHVKSHMVVNRQLALHRAPERKKSTILTRFLHLLLLQSTLQAPSHKEMAPGVGMSKDRSQLAACPCSSYGQQKLLGPFWTQHLLRLPTNTGNWSQQHGPTSPTCLHLNTRTLWPNLCHTGDQLINQENWRNTSYVPWLSTPAKTTTVFSLHLALSPSAGGWSDCSSWGDIRAVTGSDSRGQSMAQFTHLQPICFQQQMMMLFQLPGTHSTGFPPERLGRDKQPAQMYIMQSIWYFRHSHLPGVGSWSHSRTQGPETTPLKAVAIWGILQAFLLPEGLKQAPHFHLKVPSKGDVARIEILNSSGKIPAWRQVLINYLPTW